MTSLEAIKTIAEITILIVTLLSFVYKIAQMERAIYAAIDELKDVTGDRISSLQGRMDLHILESQKGYEMNAYKLENLDMKFNQKYQLLSSNLIDVQNFLRKQGFIPRHFFDNFDSQQGRGE